jgi:hypothetical protein
MKLKRPLCVFCWVSSLASASCATCSRCSRGWAATPAPATARRTARTASSCRSAATTPCTTTARSPTTSAARRFNRAAPDQSLMLLKATGSFPPRRRRAHRSTSLLQALVRDWIARASSSISMRPAWPRSTFCRINPVVPRPGMKQQMRVMATYADGDVRDVTREAFIESGNIEVIAANASGVLTTAPPRRGPVLVRYEGAYAATTMTAWATAAASPGSRSRRPQLHRRAGLQKLQR